MSVKFRVGFNISGETLFGLIAKMLPIENLSVEEIAPMPVQSRLTTAPKRLGPVHNRKSKGPDLMQGVNKVIVEALADGEPHRAADLERPLIAAGFSRNSVGSRLEHLHKHGIVEHLPNGMWRLAKREP